MKVPPTVLIFTYVEHGQANVNLATAYELALAGVNVYVASSASLRTRVERLQELVIRHTSRVSGNSTGSISFCECKGFVSLIETALKNGGSKFTAANICHPSGVSGALKSYATLDLIALPWSREEYLAAVESCKGIIMTIKPTVAAVDYAFNIAQDACKLAGQKFVIVSPNSIKELAVENQPYLAALWRYPVLSSGFPFPLKWWQIPLNIYLCIRLAILLKTSKFKELQAVRKSCGFPGDRNSEFYHGVTHISAALPEIDFPFAVIPQEVFLCGPIIMPFDPLEQSDLALSKWLDNGPTILINLGSHVVLDREAAKGIASALRILLDHHGRKSSGRMQVLWKAKTNEDSQSVIDDIIGKEMKEGWVKVVPWLEAEPVSILQHPNLICTVHHGGANSYYEGVWSGVPHVVLPVWLDTYDYANRVEFLSIGIFGSKTSAPNVRAEEFGEALVRVTGDTYEAVKFRTSAKHLKDICRAKGNGRELASMAILREVGIGSEVHADT